MTLKTTHLATIELPNNLATILPILHALDEEFSGRIMLERDYSSNGIEVHLIESLVVEETAPPMKVEA